ncbi:MAG: class I SAM-dependent methyltransferase [Dehalococcoidales bacterium]|nr:class I SAM-dependent methyltransferase [Dehalococcoidales bacterium]
MTEKEYFPIKVDKIRKRLLKYTRKAFRMLPQLDHPYILDIGCGSGIPTIELARLSQGRVLGLDIDQSALARFNKRIDEMGLTESIRTLTCSMVDMDFPDDSYDIIWAEGSIYVIGFENGLRQWRRFLKPGGFMVVHDEQETIEEKLRQIANCGYKLIGYFVLSKEVWRAEYFHPLEKLIGETMKEHALSQETTEELRHAQWELEMYRKYPDRNNSVYFVMKKN